MRAVDTVTLGAGGGAYPAAFALARSGQQVVMIDAKGVMSGNCLAEGCVPSKAIFELSELRRRMSLAPNTQALGRLSAPPDYEAVIAHKDHVQRTRYRQHDEELATEAERLQLRKGVARLIDPHTVELTTETGIEHLRADHIIIATGSDVTSITKSGGQLEVRYHQDGKDRQLEPDLVLMAVGRRPVIPDGAESISLTLDGHGLAVNTSLQVPSRRHIYAPGDVNRRSPLFHSAVRQSLVSAQNILAGDRVVARMDFTSVPTTIFAAPEGAYVGLTRSSATAQKIPIAEAAHSFGTDSRAQILAEPYGKICLFFQAESLRLLGGWVIGIDAAQLVGEIGQAVAAGLSAYDLARFADQHPTAAEGISRAARSLVG